MAESLLFTVPPPAPLSPPIYTAIRRRKRSLAASAAGVMILGESLRGDREKLSGPGDSYYDRFWKPQNVCVWGRDGLLG